MNFWGTHTSGTRVDAHKKTLLDNDISECNENTCKPLKRIQELLTTQFT